uniref:Putative s-m checkpoint control protein cid1 n=1 Tax=Lutzomyia longipalpis TaxID=7200 RepID=A0A7G3AZW6_LUTLO
MELFYFSSILEIFQENAFQIDQTTVNYLMKIVKIVNDLVKKKEIVRVYQPQAFDPEDFERFTLQRTLRCHSCNRNVPFLWANFQEHMRVCPAAGNQEIQPIPGTSKGTTTTKNNPPQKGKEAPRELPNKDLKEEEEEEGDTSSDDSSSGESSEEEGNKKKQKKFDLKAKKKELKELKELIKRKKRERKTEKQLKQDFTLKKNTTMVLMMWDETINQNVAIGEKIMNLPIYKNITDDLEKNLRPEFPDVKVYIFGSRKTGLGTYTGDLDLFIDVKNYYNFPLKDKEESVRIIDKVRAVLSKPNVPWGKFVSITHARTPILKCFNREYKISCDLSFCNGLSHINTALIRYLLTLQPDCHRVACFIKAWYKSIFFSRQEANKVSSYMITLLVIFYMQTIKLLPPIYQLHNTTGKPLMIGDWQGDFAKPSLAELNIRVSNNPKNILVGFFQYYSSFDYKTYVICPLLGYPIERQLFDTPELLPDEMIRYKEFVQKLTPCPENSKELLATDTTICVQDPLELCHNVAKGVHLPLFVKFTKLCKKSGDYLMNF